MSMPAKAKVLFVDDEPRIVNLLKIMFRADYEVFTATGGQEALKIIASERIQVIVSDQRMPEMLGIELLSKVREISPNTMRILLTGYSDLVAIVGSVNEGEVFRFLNKPWHQDEIKATIADAVNIAIETSAVVEAAPIRYTLPVKRTVLILDDSDVERHWTSTVLSQDYSCVGANSITQALNMLTQKDVSVIVCEAAIGGQSSGAFLNVLKQQYPVITAVMLTASADAELVVKLINQTQITRFLRKPMQAPNLLHAVAAAAAKNQRFRDDPRMMARHKVTLSQDAESVTLMSSIGKMLGSLRLRLFGA
jgi:response regulator RpfG family c-di-GMP phosphodiesterase